MLNRLILAGKSFVSRQRKMMCIIFLFVFSVFSRVSTIDTHLFFGFEQGRDAFRISSILKLEDIILVGPKTDIDGIFHGPWYYYMMTIPYFVGGGDPRGAVLFLIMISSIVPITFFLWWMKLTRNLSVSLFFALFVACSFELMTYSRWLSNVSPALPLFTVGIFALWNYLISKNNHWFVVSAGVIGFACQFEIVMTFWILVALSLLIISKTVLLPPKKTFILSLFVFSIWFLPLVIFNVKHDWITVQSILHYHNKEVMDNRFLDSFVAYLQMQVRLWNDTVLFVPRLFSIALLMLTVIGLIGLLRKGSVVLKKTTWMLILISMGTLPVIFFGDSIKLVQVYAGFGIVFLQLFLLSNWYWISQLKKKKDIAHVGVLTFIIFFSVFSVSRSLVFIWSDRSAFYRTIQEDLNFSDQLKIMEYIRAETKSESAYFLKSFTIPYYQEEAWQYLHKQYIGKELNPGAQTIFVTIEEKVDPYWERMWIKDLGDTRLESEIKFGKIRVQKRIRYSL